MLEVVPLNDVRWAMGVRAVRGFYTPVVSGFGRRLWSSSSGKNLDPIGECICV